MTVKRNRLTPALSKLAVLLIWSIGLALATSSLWSRPALAVNTGPSACSALTTPTSFVNIGGTATITITGFTAGSTVTVGYRNNGTGNFDLSIVKTSGPTLNPTGFADINITGTESAAFAYSSGSGDLVLTLNASDPNGSPIPQYQVSCSPPAAAGVTLNESGGSTNIGEGGTTDSFSVVLNSQPTNNVTISLAPSAQCTLSATSPLTFTNLNWNQAQTVTVTAVNDAVVEGAHTCSIVTGDTSSSDGNYNNLTVPDVIANVADNDSATVSVAQTSPDGGAAEPADNGEFTVTMSTTASTDTVVSYTVGGTATGGSDYTTLSGQVTILAGQTTAVIPVTVTNDTVVEPTETVIVTLTLATSNASITASGTASVSIGDDDAATVGVAKSSGGDAAEPADNGEFTVTMSTTASTDTVVSYTVGGTATGGSDYTTLSGQVTILAGQTTAVIPVTVLDDPTVEPTETVTVTLTLATSNPSVTASGSDSLSIADNDTAGVTVTASGGSTNIAEGGATDDFTIVLTAQPTADVTISLTPDAQCTLSTGSLTFTTSNWSSAQTVTVTAVDDDVVEGAHSCVIGGTASGDGYTGATVNNVTATVTDNDTAGVTVAGSPVAITEGGATGDFTLVLTSEPTASVTVLLSPDAAQCTLSTSSVTFDSSNWDTPQSVTVTAVNDNLVEGGHTCVITTGAASSTDGNYNGKTVNDVTAGVTDNDTAGVTVAGSPVAITEGGATGNFTVVLTAQPTADVTIGLTPDAQCTLSTGSLTFTAANWSSPQSVTVTAVDDTDDEGTHSCAIATSDTSSTDSNYDNLDVVDVTASITDNDGVSAPSDVVVQKTFESETYNFMAARLRLLARFGPRNHRMVNRDDGQFQTGSNGFNIQGEGGSMEGNFALNSAGVQRILNGDLFNVTPTASVADGDGSTVNAWIEGQFAYYNSDDNDQGNPNGNFFVGYAGADVRIHDGVVIGIMGQLDWFDEDTDTGKTDGDGWMVGPYLSARLAPNLFFDLRGMYGQSDNSSTQNIQNFTFKGDFDTDRYLVEAILTGRFDYGGTVLTPDLQFIYIWEDQDDYSVSSGANVVNVDGQLVKLGQLSTGLKVAEQMGGDGADIWPYIGGRVLWDFDNPGEIEIDGSTVSTDDIRAAISLGLDISTQSSQISVEATYDGLFSDDYEAIGGRVTFSYHW